MKEPRVMKPVTEVFLFVSEYHGVEGPVLFSSRHPGGGKLHSAPLFTTNAKLVPAMTVLAERACRDEPGRRMKLLRLSNVEVVTEIGGDR